jgi:DNA-binding HxlR family transcriptional regulator
LAPTPPEASPEQPPIPSVPPPKRHPYDQWSPDARALDLVGDKWTLLIIRDLAAGPRRFVELQRVLPGISTEQLRSRLNRMVADGLLTRQRYREVPPRVDYELTERSRELMPVVGALARWGYDWAWSAPRPGEDVNIGAVFRLAPGLLEPPSGVEGAVELVVEAGGEQTVERSDGGVLTCIVRVKAKNHFFDITFEDARVVGSQSGALRRDHILNVGHVAGDEIELAFANDGRSFVEQCALGFVQAEENFSFGEDRSFRGINVFGRFLVTGQNTSAEPDDAALLIADGKNKTAAKAIVITVAVFLTDDESGLFDDG